SSLPNESSSSMANCSQFCDSSRKTAFNCGVREFLAACCVPPFGFRGAGSFVPQCCGSLLLPFTPAVRLSRPAAGLATFRPRARARFPCAAAGRFPHAGPVALLAAILHARLRPLLLHGTSLWARSATTVFHGGL